MIPASWYTIFRPLNVFVSGVLAITLVKVSMHVWMSPLARLVMVENVKICFLLYRNHTKILDVIKTLVMWWVDML